MLKLHLKLKCPPQHSFDNVPCVNQICHSYCPCSAMQVKKAYVSKGFALYRCQEKLVLGERDASESRNTEMDRMILTAIKLILHEVLIITLVPHLCIQVQGVATADMQASTAHQSCEWYQQKPVRKAQRCAGGCLRRCPWTPSTALCLTLLPQLVQVCSEG